MLGARLTLKGHSMRLVAARRTVLPVVALRGSNPIAAGRICIDFSAAS
jgi:hypothetical protein